MIIIDAENARIGRVATFAAKELLNGEEVHIINAEKAIISGNKKEIIKKYTLRRSFKNKGNPERSPTWSKVPYMFVKRLIRGMLPRETQTGRDAFKRLRTYMGRPATLKGDSIKVKGSDRGNLMKYISINELCSNLGYNG